jgi:hypothetical protein
MALIQEKKLMADIKKSAKAGQMVRKIQPGFSVHQRLMHTLVTVCSKDPSQRSRSDKTLYSKVHSDESAAASRIAAHASAQE